MQVLSHPPSGWPALVLNAVLRVCKDMNVECSQARQ